MEIHQPHAKMSNLIFLQDDLRVQSNTPTDATAFTQVCYLVQFSPAAQMNYFALGNLEDANTMVNNPLYYKLLPNPDSQLVKVGEQTYQDFEKLIVNPAQAGIYAGWNPDHKACPKTMEQGFKDPYISPNQCPVSTGGTIGSYFSSNFNVPFTEEYFFKPTSCIAKATNMDHIKFYKYGDSIDIPIQTNLEGVHLTDHLSNSFTNRFPTQFTISGDDKYVLTSAFIYPGNNRPYKCRCYQYDPTISCTLHNKEFKPLQHSFFTMPPIKKPNGALLGQRCSVLLEQSFSITFHMNETTFDLEDKK